MTTRRNFLASLAGLGAGALWIPTLHLAFREDHADLARGLSERQLRLWEREDRGPIKAMRGINPEWDFMGRTFLVVALANQALAGGDTERILPVMDRVIRSTLNEHHGKGAFHYLLPYAMRGPMRSGTRKSLFIEGEIALMIEARRRVEDADWLPDEPLRNARKLMEMGPMLCGESYPNECWSFCNTATLAALALAGQHDLGQRWVAEAMPKLVHDDTGLLVSSFTYDGRPLDGPEGSSIWAAATFLQLVDPVVARDQYDRARHHLGRQLLGFGWGVEWPDSWPNHADVDSGPIVPIVNASAGSSGLALWAARAFGDDDFADALVASLGLAAFPIEEDGALRYAAGNQVGDAMLLVALTHGPLWQTKETT